jgi:hypothetical protein
MTSSISSTTNVDENGIASWEKNVTDVNNIDESFANARDLGYTRLNYARITTVAQLGEYNDRDIYKVQVQSNGKLSISLRNEGAEENVLDLSEYEEYLDDLKKQLDPEGYAAEQAEKKEEQEAMALLEETAPGMTLKVYMVKNGKEVLIADSSADKDSEEYQNMTAILSGEYKATKGNYYIEVGKSETAETGKDYPYAMQILQGTGYKHDYVMTQSDSEDTTNKKISTAPDTSLNSTTGTSAISAAYAAQIQAVRDEGAANLLAAGSSNLSSITSDSSDNATALFSTLLSN